MNRTGGGRFDPAEEPIYFFAGLNNSLLRQYGGVQHTHLLIALNDIADNRSELDSVETTLADEPTMKVLLDSGVFWLTNEHMKRHPGLTMDDALALRPDEIDGFSWLFDNYVKTVRRFEDSLWGYIELDQGGAANKRITRAKLEAEGLRPIPVYHALNDGWEYFDELAEGYDRICVGNVVQANQLVRKHLLATLWERRRRHPGLWIHVLGLTPNEIITVYPQSSCDSSTFVHAIRFGAGAGRGYSMGAGFGSYGNDFTYRPDAPMEAGGYVTGIQFVNSSARFLHETFRAQYRDYRRTFGAELWPAADDREAVRL